MQTGVAQAKGERREGMSPFWLFLIVPASAAIGMVLTALCSASKIGDLQIENARLRKEAAQ